MIYDLFKKCTNCGKEKCRDDFNNRSCNPDGKRYECSECTTTYNREWRSKNPERVKLWHSRFLENHPGYYRKYRIEHKEKLSAYARFWVSNNRERANELNRKSYHKRKVEYNALRRLRYLLSKLIG